MGLLGSTFNTAIDEGLIIIVPMSQHVQFFVQLRKLRH